MITSIQRFADNGIKNIDSVVEKFLKAPENMADLVYGIKNEVIQLGLDIISETFEEIDNQIRMSGKRREKWSIVKTDPKTLITSLGIVNYHKTLFKNKETGERAYLMDRMLELDPHNRLSEDAEASMLTEAVKTSYSKAGKETSIMTDISKQTVKNKLHCLHFPEEKHPEKPKKVVDYLYIDADEDHVSLQFRNKKGDLTVGDNNRKNNCVMTKLVYVYEGIEPEAPKSKRNRLIAPHYFSGVYSDEGNDALWDRVYTYLNEHYDLEKVKKIYLNADGGTWIQAGKHKIAGITTVMDEFHLRKYLLHLTGHLKDSAEDARTEMIRIIKYENKEEFKACIDKILLSVEDENRKKRIKEGRDYIINNWTAAKTRLRHTDSIVGCSAESHVEHVLSTRMSSDPMGWSLLGADKMSRLRAYYWNDESMLELVRAQKEELPKACGAENENLRNDGVLSNVRKHNRYDKYYDALQHSIGGLSARKATAIINHIWDL